MFFVHLTRRLYRIVRAKRQPFSGSRNYWLDRYRTGGRSGGGSYGQLAEFKSSVLNDLVRTENLQTVIEYGCGDGNQLKSAEYPNYVGFDISPEAIAICKSVFSRDQTKCFKLAGDYDGETAQLTLSLDVIYHLVEDDIFDRYMRRLFDSAKRLVVIYSSNTNENLTGYDRHIRHRKFSEWIAIERPEWHLLKRIPNIYPYTGDSRTTSFADFYIYKKRDLRQL